MLKMYVRTVNHELVVLTILLIITCACIVLNCFLFLAINYTLIICNLTISTNFSGVQQNGAR